MHWEFWICGGLLLACYLGWLYSCRRRDQVRARAESAILDRLNAPDVFPAEAGRIDLQLIPSHLEWNPRHTACQYLGKLLVSHSDRFSVIDCRVLLVIISGRWTETSVILNEQPFFLNVSLIMEQLSSLVQIDPRCSQSIPQQPEPALPWAWP